MVLFLILGAAPLPDGAGSGVFQSVNIWLNQVKESLGQEVHRIFAADDKDYFLEGGSYKVELSSGSNAKEIDLTNSEQIILSLKSREKKSGTTTSVQGAQINFSNVGERVCDASATNSGTDTSSITIKKTDAKRGVGAEQIAGTIRISENGKTINYNFNFIVKSDVKILEEPKYSSANPNKTGYRESRVFTNDQDEVHDLIMPMLNTKYQIKLNGYKPPTLPNGNLDYKDHLEWQSKQIGIDPSRVISVNPDNGEVSAIGAGFTYLEAVPKHNAENKAKSDKVRIFVPLKLSTENANMGNYDSFANAYLEKTSVVQPEANSTSKKIYTNIFDLEDLEWEITGEDGKKEINGKKIEEFATVTSINNKRSDSASAIRLDIKRAGKYRVTAKIKKADAMYSTLDYSNASFIYEVPLIKKDINEYLNVGDEYNIYNNTNIGKISDYQFTVTGDSAAVTVNEATSVVTANQVGNVTVKVTRRGVPTDSFDVNLSVIDSVKLNQNAAVIPVGGTLDLSALTTDVSSSSTWKWESDNTGVATVEGKGLSAVVKGIKPGEAMISVSFNSKGGVTKKASCKVTVKAGVTSIKLVPTEEIVDVGKIVSIKAMVEPAAISGVYLYWKSSDPKIVEIDNENDHSLTNSVTAKAPGVAVVMALNKDNVVLGSAVIKVKQPVKSISLSNRVLEKAIEEKTYQLTATVLPAEATVSGLVWTSSKPEVATVDANGLITFKKPGNTTIICASASDPKILDTCDVNVLQGVVGLTVDKKEVSLSVGETYKLGAEVKPADASHKNIVFVSLDSKVATVSNTGLITAKAPGTAYIMISTEDKKFNATCIVKVTQKPTGFKLSAASLTLDVGGRFTLEPTFNPKTVTNTKVIWTTSDASVAKVDAKGTVTGTGQGQCIITGTTDNGLSANCHVKVNQQVRSITLDQTEAELPIGEELELEVIFNSDDVTNKDVKWKTSNSSVATVDKKGIVKGKMGGIAIITVTSTENGMSANCIVTVIEPVTKITLNKKKLVLSAKEKYTLVATVENKSASKKKVKWSSNKKSVATVSSKGIVYAKKIGRAVIKAKATDGSGEEAICIVEVVRKISSIEVEPSFISVRVGQKKKLKTKVNPKNATNKKLTFKSLNTDVALIDHKGRITAIGAGKTKLVVSASNDKKMKQEVVIQVREYVPASNITVSATNITMGVGDKQSIIYTLSPNGSDDKVTWNSNNKASVRVNSKGLVTAVAPGSSLITATTTSGKTATTSITVVGLNFYSLDLEQYDSYRLSVLGDLKNVSWDSGNHSIATVSGGNVTAKKAGTCNIYARVNGALLTCRVTVRNIR